MRVTRVYWWTDWARGVRAAVRELWRSLFGCHHRWDTVRFLHVGGSITSGGGARPNETGYWAVNECRKCKQRRVFGTWSGPRD
jgi:hypothetical protein